MKKNKVNRIKIITVLAFLSAAILSFATNDFSVIQTVDAQEQDSLNDSD
ncbi:hypothetical protein [Alkalibacterium thalassium]|nr:hypothetical protein [Alkalibacterium thalassium]